MFYQQVEWPTDRVMFYISEYDLETTAEVLQVSPEELTEWGSNIRQEIAGEDEYFFAVDALMWKDFKEVYNVSA